MKPDLLQIGFFPDFVQEMINAEYCCHDWETVCRNQRLLSNIRAIVTRSNFEVSRDVVMQLPQLGAIVTCGVGYDLIPLDLAAKRNIAVANTPNVLNSAVAELAVGMTLALLRQLHEADRFVKSFCWETAAFPLGFSLAGKQVGIIGLGRIGKEIARRLAAFDVHISYYGRTDQKLDLRFEPDLISLAKNVDILIVTAPGGSGTSKLIDAKVLSALGPKGILVNVARGSLIDESALVDALDAGDIAGAALDVFDGEPNVRPQLLRQKNTLLTPHIGSATYETRLAMANLTLDNLRQFFKDGTVCTPVR